MLRKYMQQLREDMELDQPFPSLTPGTYTIPLEDDLAVYVTANQPQGYTFSCNVAPTPKNKEAEFLTELMLANLFGQGTRGAVLGLSNDETFITLEYYTEQDVEYQDFKQLLEDFLNSVDFWRDEALQRQSETQP